MTFENILVPYDGSVSSLRAFNKAVELSKQRNSHIKVVSCLDIGNLGGWYIDKRINNDIMRKAKSATKERFSKLEGIAEKTVSCPAYRSTLNHTMLYEHLHHSKTMETIQTQRPQSIWDKMVHAPFKKVVKFDLICMGLGIVMGMGLGAFLVSNV